ncbi:MAG: metallophosphoesterase family protein [Alphaproteobacteria bacterium]|nr:metallophosphoesterase family protein [Alphaproteobacteria bacterium]
MSQKPSTPTNYRLYAVGDIHGRLDLLNQMLAMIEDDAAKFRDKTKVLIFLGDYIDRGLDSCGVIERLITYHPPGLTSVFLRGNHEDMFLTFMKGHIEIALSWLSLGGAAALASYGVNSLSGVVGKGKLETLYKDVKAKIPAAHLTFIKKTVMSVTYGHYYFVHAGIRPHVALGQQNPMDQLSIRGDFLFSEEHFGRVIVHGHTIRPEPEVKRNRIGIDTGAFATGKLTCLVLDGTHQKFLST